MYVLILIHFVSIITHILDYSYKYKKDTLLCEFVCIDPHTGAFYLSPHSHSYILFFLFLDTHMLGYTYNLSKLYSFFVLFRHKIDVWHNYHVTFWAFNRCVGLQYVFDIQLMYSVMSTFLTLN
jgi:hypothetical protein